MCLLNIIIPETAHFALLKQLGSELSMDVHVVGLPCVLCHASDNIIPSQPEGKLQVT